MSETNPIPLKVRGDYSNLVVKKEIDGEIIEFVSIDEMNEDQIDKYCRDMNITRDEFPRTNMTVYP